MRYIGLWNGGGMTPLIIEISYESRDKTEEDR